VAIGACVDWQDECLKVNQHSSLKSANETASALLEMSAKTVKWHRKTGNVKGIADKNALSVEGEDGSAVSKDWNVWVITHAHLQIFNGLVRDEGWLVRSHVICGASVSNDKAAWLRADNWRLQNLPKEMMKSLGERNAQSGRHRWTGITREGNVRGISTTWTWLQEGELE
jgi:hypothetical protein